MRNTFLLRGVAKHATHNPISNAPMEALMQTPLAAHHNDPAIKTADALFLAALAALAAGVVRVDAENGLVFGSRCKSLIAQIVRRELWV
jgi:hypothetical protein